MGGDEANNIFEGGGFQDSDIDRSQWDFPWERSPACQSFLYAYHDILDGLAPSDLATQRVGAGYWRSVSSGTGYNGINDFANSGFDTLVAVPDFLYFDFPQEVDPEERGYYWATRFTDTRKIFTFAPENLPQNAETSVNRNGTNWTATGSTRNQDYVGMQGQLWGETVRTAQQMEYMIFPRLLALAERAWHKAEWELDYQSGQTFSGTTSQVNMDLLNADYAGFAQSMALKELPKLDAAGVRYRIPVPGAINDGGVLSMNTEFPGMPMEYSTDGSNFTTFTNGVAAGSVRAIRALSANGGRTGRVDSFP